ncbi:hypothetical protein TL16_g03724 [Triparma laevis f. inornata]|uniref:Polymer-forming cytoskeletal protein n=1 Tax=Triparma laevis f. inornata TaxID=1714386 RepID=A0A9W7A021_9STRA|nr:hypothetical protein TL16_g03724 [Triparma laevis f. inornata]
MKLLVQFVASLTAPHIKNILIIFYFARCSFVTLEVIGEVNFAGALSAAGGVSTSSVKVDEEVEAGGVVTGKVHVLNDAEVDGKISVKGDAVMDFLTASQIEAGSLKVDGVVSVEEGVEAATGVFSESIKSPKVDVEGEITAESIVVSGTGGFAGGVTGGSLEIGGDGKIAGLLEGSEAAFSGQIKSTSLMTSRLYSEDITASGFVLGEVVKSKGDVEAMANVRGVNLIAGEWIRGNDVVVENKVTTLIAEVGGMLTAGGIETKKMLASESLSVGNVDVGASILAMSAKIEEMQGVINQLVAFIETKGGEGGKGGGEGEEGKKRGEEGGE